MPLQVQFRTLLAPALGLGTGEVWPVAAIRLEALQTERLTLVSVALRAMLPCSSASGSRITYEHHEESPALEEGHREAQRGSSWPWLVRTC